MNVPPEERVRRKPTLIFGDDYLDGSKQVFTDMLKILLAEAHHGQCSRIDITLYKNGTIELATTGRGFRVGTEEQWKDLFLVLPDKHAYGFLLDKTVFSLYEENMDCSATEERRFYDDLSLPCIQYVCKHMDCIIYRNGRMHELRFKKGIPTSVVFSECDSQQGMHISFMIDPDVFHNENILPPDFVIDIAKNAATSFTNLLVTVRVETNNGLNEHLFDGNREASSAKEAL